MPRVKEQPVRASVYSIHHRRFKIDEDHARTAPVSEKKVLNASGTLEDRRRDEMR